MLYSSVARRRRAWATAFALMLPLWCRAGQVTIENGYYRYDENFTWAGNHAATIGQAPNQATTVWWPESDWDARGDTTFLAVTPLTDDGVTLTNRFHVDIHKAASSDPRNGVLSNTQYTVGGDGSAGIGIIHLDYQDIASARLRNPLLIAANQPGVVRFYASAFQTTGHWFEIAITPKDAIVGGEHTSVPSVDSGLPFPNSTVTQPGPGHDTLADAINIIAFGSADFPCTGFPGWRTRFGVSKTHNGVRTHTVTPGMTQGDFLPTDPAQANTLVHWEIRFFPDHITLGADMDEDGTFAILESWPVSVPWPKVHVHLIGVGYQSTHHPAAPCNLGHIREIQWRNVSVFPVEYLRTDVFPKNIGTQQAPKALGFVAYDLRDIQRFGAPINGVPQPNTGEFGVNHPGKYCEDAGFPCNSGAPATPTLNFDLPAAMLNNLSAVQLLADLKDADEPEVHASVTAMVNAQALGRFPEHDAVLSNVDNYAEWVRRALPVPVSALNAGGNALRLDLETGAYVDRVEFELMYGEPLDALFVNGFESTSAAAGAKHQHLLRPADIAVPQPWFPVGHGEHLLHQCSQ